MNESMRKTLLQAADEAFEKRQFVVYYQPVYKADSGLIAGAEALVRWEHPIYGLIPPHQFVSLFEKNGLISKLDYYVFETVCCFMRKAIDEGTDLVPISVNLSRIDIYQPGFVQSLATLRDQFRIPQSFIRIEVTESIAMGDLKAATEKAKEIHDCGFTLCLDDFGSGYSSLNVLKDIDYDVIKLDMLFLKDDVSGKGGTIISSIVRMAKWMGLPVIAEGVETREQADYMDGIGCGYLQGFYFSKPISEPDFKAILNRSEISSIGSLEKPKRQLDPVQFWNDKSLETLIFNNFAGAAAVFSYKVDGRIEYLRVNKKYIREMGMNTTVEDIVHSNPWDAMEEDSKQTYARMLKRAIDTEEEQECETWRNVESSCCGSERLCIRSTVVPIGKSDDEVVFYDSIRNVTVEKNRMSEGKDYERGFRNITEQVNIYYWEYTVSTREMRPCFRCMRDLGLPPLVKNYPEPAIAAGIIPPDFADMYRDWHKQIAAGVKELDAVIPLTVGRVPFHVRYTTEFDELGRPVKAYGSATLKD